MSLRAATLGLFFLATPLFSQKAQPVTQKTQPVAQKAQPVAPPARANEATEDALENPDVTLEVYSIYDGMVSGKMDFAVMTPELGARLDQVFTPEVRASFVKRGPLQRLTVERRERGTFATKYEYLATFRDTQKHFQIFINADGKVSDFIVAS